MTNAEFEHKCMVTDLVTKAWQLPNRPDLLKDCIEYVLNHTKEVAGVNELVLKFLSSHCTQAISSQDLEHMSKEHG